MKLEAESYLKSGSNELRILEYRLAERSFGINILKVKRIVNETPCLTATPNMPPDVTGVFKESDAIIPIIDLPSFLGLPSAKNDKRKKIIITEFFGSLNSFYVDHVDWIHHFRWEDVIDAESVLSRFDQKFVIGIVKPSEDRMIQLLDYETIILSLTPKLESEEWSKVKREHIDGAGKRILLSEDSPSIRDMLTVEFSERGYEVISTKNGKEAFEKIESGENYDLVLSDVEMPQMDGLALTCAIRNHKKSHKLPVIIYSSIGDTGMKKRAEYLKADAHITKLNIEQLVAKVEELTNRN